MMVSNDIWINASSRKPKINECVAVRIKSEDGTECKNQIGKFIKKIKEEK